MQQLEFTASCRYTREDLMLILTLLPLTAVTNAMANYLATGYFPYPGSTQVWMLGEELLLAIIKELQIFEQQFPSSIVIG